jgi:hypothetical protein
VLSVSTLSLVRSGLRLAGKLDRDLAFKDLLARELSNSTLSLAGSREVDEGVTDRTVGARVLGNGDGLAVCRGTWLAYAAAATKQGRT